MTIRDIATTVWVALEAEGADGPAAARKVFVPCDGVRLFGDWCTVDGHACSIAALRMFVGKGAWDAFVADVLKQWDRLDADPDVLADEAEESRNDRADEATDLARAG